MSQYPRERASARGAEQAFDRLYAAVSGRRYVSLSDAYPFTLVVNGAPGWFLRFYDTREVQGMGSPERVVLRLAFGPSCIWHDVKRTLLERYHFEVTDDWEETHVRRTPRATTVTVNYTEWGDDVRIPAGTMALIQQLSHSALDALRRMDGSRLQ